MPRDITRVRCPRCLCGETIPFSSLVTRVFCPKIRLWRYSTRRPVSDLSTHRACTPGQTDSGRTLSSPRTADTVFAAPRPTLPLSYYWYYLILTHSSLHQSAHRGTTAASRSRNRTIAFSCRQGTPTPSPRTRCMSMEEYGSHPPPPPRLRLRLRLRPRLRPANILLGIPIR